ncbi:MAG: peptide-methionine (S)-S-oxide reductase MsrA [Bacteroidales bacterium]|nr:peptide-methionine (S)-S-oxide reductase MsrA [Bacteroidales bacterium]
MKELYLAAGCFWGGEKYLSLLDGVIETEVGFANGNTENPTYREVYTDTTGYAETIRVVFDPEVLPLEKLVRMYFRSIDPLSVNRQGEDEGTRYRTGVYYVDAEDLPALKAVFAEEEAKAGAPLAVELLPLKNFYPADESHQDYLEKNPGGYCHLPFALFEFASSEAGKKKRAYREIEDMLASLLEGETDPVVRMAETAAVVHERMGFFWTGFYRVRGDELLLGPFQGPVACIHIPFGKGVCGTAWKENRTIVVPDVEAFPGHIACSSRSRSEIVVPLREKGQVVAVLDIDSTETGTFDSTDALMLERLLRIV